MSSSFGSITDIIIHGGFPLPLHWGGWETSTHRLKSQGWEIMAYETRNTYSDSIRLDIGATSPDRTLIVHGRLAVPYGHLMGSFSEYGSPILNHLASGGIQMSHYTATDRYIQLPSVDFTSLSAMAPIDIYSTTRSTGFFGDLKCFKYRDESPSIYIHPHSENELLDMLLKIQYPNQQEIKKKLILPDAKPIIKAQVFTLAA